MEPLPFLEDAPFLPGSVPTLLSLINEPPMGADVNVDTEETGLDMTFFLNRDVVAGEELYIDYGRNYDRSSYQRF